MFGTMECYLIAFEPILSLISLAMVQDSRLLLLLLIITNENRAEIKTTMFTKFLPMLLISTKPKAPRTENPTSKASQIDAPVQWYMKHS